MGYCKMSPGRVVLTQHLINCDEILEKVTYPQWISTYRPKSDMG